MILPPAEADVQDAAPQILIVDDDRKVRRVLMHAFKGTGAICHEAEHGEEALLRIASNPGIQLILSDIQMPKMDGMALLERVRAQWPDIGIIMISGFDDVDVAVRCLSMGAMDYLGKPFQMDEVRVRVAQAIEKRRLILEERRLLTENRRYQERLKEKVSAQASRLEQLFVTSVESLAEALEAKDPYTRGHSVRVSHYATIIAREMELSPEHLRQVELGGNVHDIGKIGVREDVLHKAGRLTADEYAHIMTHPLIGWRILGALLEETPMALSIVRSHHERFDGRGVPDGLAGAAIPLEARIVAVADSFDAMTSDRPYRRDGLTVDDAVREVVRCGGTQFDPEVVSAFVHAVERGCLQVVPRVPTYSARRHTPLSVVVAGNQLSTLAS